MLAVFWLLRGRARIAWFAAASLALLTFNDPLAGAVVATVALIAIVAPAFHAVVSRSSLGVPRVMALVGIANYGALLLPLLVLKYPRMLIFADASHAPGALSGAVQLTLPLGISYFTLRAVMYVRAAIRGEIARQSPDALVCYLAFAPTASAGPIDAPQGFFTRFGQASRLTLDDVMYAGSRIAIGVILKFLVADSLQVPIAAEFQAGSLAASPFRLLLFGPLYSLYLYTEFSGYSHMAIGCAALAGFESTENFARPLTRTNISEFWRSWHISLTSFLRTHVFLPAAYVLSRHVGQRTAAYLATGLTFVICGAWHGDGWNFVLWGAYHAILLIVHQAFREVSRKVAWLRRLRRRPAYSALGWFLTFGAVSAGWVLFCFDLGQIAEILHISGQHAGLR
jgi:alginate O-acetyltransferase complex protein AlgI